MKKTIIVALVAIAAILSPKLIFGEPPNTPKVITDISQAWVMLYDDKGNKDSVLTVKYPEDIADLGKRKWDSGKKGPGDRISAVTYQIPTGWMLVLYDDHDHKDSQHKLKGTGEVVTDADLGSFSDKASSLRWERTQ